MGVLLDGFRVLALEGVLADLIALLLLLWLASHFLEFAVARWYLGKEEFNRLLKEENERAVSQNRTVRENEL